MELFAAHRQWAKRPDDERFPDLESLYRATKSYAEHATQKEVAVSDLRVEKQDEDIVLMGRRDVPARFTHWGFGQLCVKLGAPAAYLRSLPATLAAQNLNHGLKIQPPNNVQLLFHENGNLVLRAITSERYHRIWNWEVAERLLGLNGWEPATPDQPFEKTTALYASDHDMFVFLRNPNLYIKEPGTDSPLYRGVIVQNSEVGASALKFMSFLYRYMCGNHIIWGASQVIDFSLRHIGTVRERMELFHGKIRQYMESSANEEQQKIATARSHMLGGTKEEVLDFLFGKRSLLLSRRSLEAGYDAVIEEQDGSPRSVWGMMQGLTRYSQSTPYADERQRIDTAAGKLMELV